jgi:hypothetical protein
MRFELSRVLVQIWEHEEEKVVCACIEPRRMGREVGGGGLYAHDLE